MVKCLSVVSIFVLYVYSVPIQLLTTVYTVKVRKPDSTTFTKFELETFAKMHDIPTDIIGDNGTITVTLPFGKYLIDTVTEQAGGYITEWSVPSMAIGNLSDDEIKRRVAALQERIKKHHGLELPVDENLLISACGNVLHYDEVVGYPASLPDPEEQ